MIRAPRGYAALITAAGRGTRAGGDLPKQWRKLGRDSALARSIGAFAGFSRIIVTVAPQDMDRALAEIAGPVVLVAGGATRSESVRAGLETLEGAGVTHVLIHDGARPLVSDAVIRRLYLLSATTAHLPSVFLTSITVPP